MKEVIQRDICEIDTSLSNDIFLGSRSASMDIDKKNVELGNSFKTKYPDANPVDKFDEGYSSSESETFKGAMNKIIFSVEVGTES